MTNKKAVKRIATIERQANEYLYGGTGYSVRKAEGAVMTRLHLDWEELMHQVRGDKWSPNVSQEWRAECEKTGSEMWYNFADVLA